MKKNLSILLLAITVLIGCQKTETVQRPTDSKLPTVVTSEITNISNETASCGGDVVQAGDSTVTERGIIWGTDPSLNENSTKVIAGADTGTFSVSLNGLSCSTKYFVKAYAKSSLGVAYGEIINFTTTLPEYIHTFNLYKSAFIDTVLFKATIYGDQPTAKNLHYIANELQLPPGVFIYVKFDSVYHKIIARSFNMPDSFVHQGDTLRIGFAFDMNSNTVLNITGQQGIDGAYNHSYCDYSVHLAGQAITNNSTTYNCKFQISGYHSSNTRVWSEFINDSTCNSKCPFY